MYSPTRVFRTGLFGFAVLLFAIGSFAQSGGNSSRQDSPSTAAPSSTGNTGQAANRVRPLNESTDHSAPPPGAQVIGNPEEIKLDAGDLVTIQVFGAPELSDDERVGSSGDIYVALIGSVHVQDMNPEEAQQAIEDKLRDGGFLRDPHVSLFVKEYATAGIAVTGEVSKPGIYPLIGSHNLFDAISAAGGTTNRAGNEITIAHHSDPEHPERVTIDGDIAESKSANAQVYPGDTVVVSKAGIIYVVGAVKVPGGYVMEHNNAMTAMQALSMAQGNDPGASLKSARIVRKGPDGTKEIPVDLAEIEKAKLPDVPLQSDDVLFVPTSTGKNMAKRSAASILQMATGLLIYHPF